ncbi:hypothetical protein MLD38_034579 [Melastoma candidum]|uniref:Uncharacterized protein n=1 Tax=Melastoma candidum TaxID=119954 RepID=A0ACB9MCA1_9MYRT|nr:hypothetical protein MLD38_034579 [Melastoma candidum]
MSLGMRYMPYMAMIFVQCVYAALALLSKAAMSRGMSPFVFVVYRQFLAFLALSPPAFFFERKRSVPLTFRLLCKIFLVSFCGLTLSLNLYYIAIGYTSTTFAAASTNLIPAITFTIVLLLRARITVAHDLCNCFKVGKRETCWGSRQGDGFPDRGIGGTRVCLCQGGDSSSSHSQQWIKDSLIMFSANMLWSLWLILQGRLIKEYPSKIRLTALQCLFGSTQSTCWAIAMEKNPSGVVVTGVTYCIQVWVTEKKGPVFTSVFTPLALIITAVSSAFLWKESLYWGSVGGAILMVVGLYLVLWGKSQEEDGEEEDVPLPNTKDGMIGGHPAVASSV